MSNVTLSTGIRLSAFMPSDIRFLALAGSAAAGTTLIFMRSARMSRRLSAEVKARANGAGFTTLGKWLGNYDALFLQRNGADPLVLLPWRVWARILGEVRR